MRTKVKKTYTTLLSIDSTWIEVSVDGKTVTITDGDNSVTLPRNLAYELSSELDEMLGAIPAEEDEETKED